MNRIVAGGLTACSLLSPMWSAAAAQAPVPSVSLGFGVDTTIADVGSIVGLMRAYLAQPDSTARARGLWSSTSAFDRRVGDLTAQAYQGFPATIIGVTGSRSSRARARTAYTS